LIQPGSKIFDLGPSRGDAKYKMLVFQQVGQTKFRVPVPVMGTDQKFLTWVKSAIFDLSFGLGKILNFPIFIPPDKKNCFRSGQKVYGSKLG